LTCINCRQKSTRSTGVPENAIRLWVFIEPLVNRPGYIEIGPEENAAEFLAVVEPWTEVKTA